MKIFLHIIYTLLTALFCSCSGKIHYSQPGTINGSKLIGTDKTEYTIIVVDSCEYITHTYTFGYSGYGFMAHKGNCKYCTERNRQLLESIK